MDRAAIGTSLHTTRGVECKSQFPLNTNELRTDVCDYSPQLEKKKLISLLLEEKDPISFISSP